MKLSTIIRYAILAVTIGLGSTYAQMSVVNGASFDANGPMAPGSFATLFGQNLCSRTASGEWVGPGELPVMLEGCSVTVNGIPAMLHYVSPEQVNFIIPDGAAHGTAQVVMHNGSARLNGTFNVGQAGPGIFTMNGTGMGPGAILHGTLWQAGPFSVSTGGRPTPLSVFVTGLDLTAKPAVTIGGKPAEVTWWGHAPGFAGLQQVNIMLPAGMAGAGTAPMTVTCDGQTSNIASLSILPTTEMMQGMPGWGPGMMVGENQPRKREMSSVAFNPADNTALVTDREDDALRVISLDTLSTLRTITLPRHSEAHAVAVNASGTMAAVALGSQASVALIHLTGSNTVQVIGTGVSPNRLVFVGSTLLVTNSASGTVSVIDTTIGDVVRTVPVGFGPAGIAAGTSVAVVANMQGGSLSVIHLADFSVTEVPLRSGSRPHEVAISTSLGKAVITEPTANGFLVMDLKTHKVTGISTDVWNAMGPGAVTIHGSQAFLANQMTANISVVDLATNTVVDTFPVDPGPRALAVNDQRNQLLVLSEGIGVLSVVDLANYRAMGRANATSGDRNGIWSLPTITSITPNSVKRGTRPFSLTITGSNLQDVKEIEFHDVMNPNTGMGMGGGMMGSGQSGGFMALGNMGNQDEHIKISHLQVSADGASITATVEVSAQAAAGIRRVGLETGRGHVMGGLMFNAFFTVTE